MNRAEALLKSRPHLVPDEDYIVYDLSDGQGVQIQWFSEEPFPSENELESAYKEVRRKQKVDEMAECALEEIRGLFRTSLPSYEVLGIHNAKLLASNTEDYPPRYTAAMELIRDTNIKLEEKLYEVSVAEDPETVTWD